MGVKSIKVLSLLMLRHSFVKKKFLGKIVLKKKTFREVRIIFLIIEQILFYIKIVKIVKIPLQIS